MLINIKMIFVLGELGGRDEYSLVEALKQGKISKPVVAWVSGTYARLFKSEVQFGHAGAKSGGEMESTQAKNQALHDAGAVVPTSFEAFETVIKERFEKLLRGAMLLLQRKFKPPQIPEDLNTVIKSGKVRAPTHIISTISDDRGEEPCYAGIPMSSIVEQGYGVGDVISRYCTRFNEICVMLCADHGPCVSGAHNTIVTARAGKDLVSSLVLGLLTIGPRFGGAIDDAARYFKDAYDKRINSITVTRNMLSHERKAPQPLGVLKPWALLVDEYLKRVVDESIDLWWILNTSKGHGVLKGFSQPPEVKSGTYNPEVLTSQKRQWASVQLQSLFHHDHRPLKEPSRLFESMVVVGLHPNYDIQALQKQYFGRKSEGSGKFRSAFSGQHQSRVEPNLEPQVLFVYPPEKQLPLKYEDLLSFCFPGGVEGSCY
ncbi:unnamed protein product [Camellia sinensis]